MIVIDLARPMPWKICAAVERLPRGFLRAIIVDESVNRAGPIASRRRCARRGATGPRPHADCFAALEMVLLGGHYVPACALDPALEPVFLPRRDTAPKEVRKGSKAVQHIVTASANKSCGACTGRHQPTDHCEDTWNQPRARENSPWQYLPATRLHRIRAAAPFAYL